VQLTHLTDSRPIISWPARSAGIHLQTVVTTRIHLLSVGQEVTTIRKLINEVGITERRPSKMRRTKAFQL